MELISNKQLFCLWEINLMGNSKMFKLQKQQITQRKRVINIFKLLHQRVKTLMRSLRKVLIRQFNNFKKKRNHFSDINYVNFLYIKYSYNYMIPTAQISKEDKLKQLNEKLDKLMQKNKVNIESIQKKCQKVKVSQVKVDGASSLVEEKNIELKKTKKIHKEQKQKDNKILRKAAGVVWQDKTMNEWSDSDYRIFCGNLGNQVSDEILSNAFRRYNSFQKAKVVRDRRTGKPRGYGFVSFTQPRDFLNAIKQMNGMFVGNRPIKVTKSSWKDRCLDSQKNQQLPSDFKINSKKETNKVCVNFKYISPY